MCHSQTRPPPHPTTRPRRRLPRAPSCPGMPARSSAKKKQKNMTNRKRRRRQRQRRTRRNLPVQAHERHITLLYFPCSPCVRLLVDPFLFLYLSLCQVAVCLVGHCAPWCSLSIQTRRRVFLLDLSVAFLLSFVLLYFFNRSIWPSPKQDVIALTLLACSFAA